MRWEEIIINGSMTGGRKCSFLFALLLLAAFVFLAYRLETNSLSSFDSRVYRVVSQSISPGVTLWAKGVSAFCSVPVMLPTVAAFLLIGWKKRAFRFYGLTMALNVASVWLVNLAIKAVFHRERPNFTRLAEETGFSFPSAHAMVSAAFYGYLIYLCTLFLKKPWKQICAALLALLVAFIGVSRIYLGVHYASDVLAGLLIGAAWVILFVLFMEKIRGNRASVRAHVPRKR